MLRETSTVSLVTLFYNCDSNVHVYSPFSDTRFSTQYYDIGFSVEMNGAVKVPYTRCASHKAAVCGTLEVTDPSICVLKWDNSYAKCKLLHVPKLYVSNIFFKYSSSILR